MMKKLRPALIFGALFSVALILSSFTTQGNENGNNVEETDTLTSPRQMKLISPCRVG